VAEMVGDEDALSANANSNVWRRLKMKLSYPLHRKSKIEEQLFYIHDPVERRRSFQVLHVLNRVIEADLSYCRDCIADCLPCLRERKRQLRLKA
jgi:hypothetical protein